MGRRGPAPDPIPLKILKGRGNGKDTSGYMIPPPSAFNRGAPDPPDWLSTPARELWDKITPGLEALDLLKPEDLTTLVTYCETWATYREALEQVRCGGMVVANSKTGIPHKNPALNALETAGQQLLRFAIEFGLTPAAEVSLARLPADVDEADPFSGTGT